MKIKVISDIHLEFSYYEVENTDEADVLILSGDICLIDDLHSHKLPESTAWNIGNNIPGLGARQQIVANYHRFFETCSKKFKNVIYILGNHEFYYGKFYASISHVREELAHYSNIHILEQNSVILDDIVFVGGTLWTNCNNGHPVSSYTVQTGLNDYQVIRNDRLGYTKLRAAHTIERFINTKAYIEQTINEHADKTVVVCTHHSPSTQSISPIYRNDFHMNGGYASDLSNFILDHPQIKLWTHGHLHNFSDYNIGETRIICNPRGYQTLSSTEDTGFCENLTISISAKMQDSV